MSRLGRPGNRTGSAWPMVAIADVRQRSKAYLLENSTTPDIQVEPETFTVTIDGDVAKAAPAAEFPVASATSSSGRF
jgi:urease subunit alpha